MFMERDNKTWCIAFNHQWKNFFLDNHDIQLEHTIVKIQSTVYCVCAYMQVSNIEG